MKVSNLAKLDLKIYEETLNNGLKIIVLPMKNVRTSYITLSTNYGSIQREFVPYGGDKMITVPDGIAHFLEHKMFEQKDGVDPFEFFARHGADANANTTNFKTTYLFSGSKYIKENLNFLLDYVYSPYFTDENVEKEKGIIEQEMLMYEDDPYSVIDENLVSNLFINHPIKVKVIGTKKSVYSITKEDLYTCYNTFYQPSNMFLVATGNVSPKEIINTVKNNMAKKKFNEPFKINVKKYNEPDEVCKKSEIKTMNVNIPKVGIAYKIPVPKGKANDYFSYLSLFFDNKCGRISVLNEKLKKNHIINENLHVYLLKTDSHICAFIFGETIKTNKLLNEIKLELKDRSIEKKDFERKKKVRLASLISGSDSVYAMNSQIMHDMIDYGKIEKDLYGKIEKLSYAKLKKIVDNMSLENYATYIINPK